MGNGARLLLVETGSRADLDAEILRHSPKEAIRVRLLGDSVGLFEAIADAVSLTHTETPLSDLARWATSLTDPVTLVLAPYDLVSTMSVDADLGWLLSQSPLLNVVAIGRHFASLDGPSVAPLVPTKKVAALEPRGMEEVALSPGARRMAGALALTDGMTLSIAARVLNTSESEAAHWIAELDSTGILRRKWDTHPTVFFIRTEFSQAALEEARKIWGDSAAKALVSRRAQLLLPDHPVAAINHLIKAGNLANAEDALRKYYCLALYADHRIGTRLLEFQPESLAGFPALLTARLIAKRSGGPAEARRLHAAAEAVRDAAEGELEGSTKHRASVLCSLMIAQRSLGETEAAVKTSLNLEAAIAAEDLPNRSTKWSSIALFYLEIGLSQLVNGDAYAAKDSVIRARRAAEKSGQAEEMGAAHAFLAVLHALFLQPEYAAYNAGRARALLATIPELNAETRMFLVLAELVSGSGMAGGAEWDKTLDWADGYAHNVDEWPLLVIAESVRNRWVAGPLFALRVAQKRLAGKENWARADGPMRALLRAHVMNLATCGGDYQYAQQLADAGDSEQSGFLAAAKSRLALFTGDPEAALELAAFGLSAESGSRRDCLLLSAVAMSKLGQTEEIPQLIDESTEDLTAAEVQERFALLPSEDLGQLIRALPARLSNRLLPLFESMPANLISDRR